MCEIFTENAKRVMQLAGSEVTRLNNDHIGTKHVLLALIGTECSARSFLTYFVDLNKLTRTIKRLGKPAPQILIASGNLPQQTPRLEKAIKHATEEAKSLCHDRVGTGCLLLGLLKEGGEAAEILSKFGLTFDLTFENTRNKLLYFLKNSPRE